MECERNGGDRCMNGLRLLEKKADGLEGPQLCSHEITNIRFFQKSISLQLDLTVSTFTSYRHLCMSISKIPGSPAACPASLQALTSLLRLGTAWVLKASGFARKCRGALTMIKSRLFRLCQLPDPSPGKGAQCIKHIHTPLSTFASVRI